MGEQVSDNREVNMRQIHGEIMVAWTALARLILEPCKLQIALLPLSGLICPSDIINDRLMCLSSQINYGQMYLLKDMFYNCVS
jgi:hypothetical protein